MSNVWLRAYRLLGVSRWSRTRLGEALFLRTFTLYKMWFEDPHAAFIRRHPEVFAGGHVLDVGANIGYTAAVFARAVSPGFRVFAFEPEPLNFRRLQRTIASRGLAGVVTPIQSAVGDDDGTASLAVNPDHPGDHRIAPSGDLTVPVCRLDTFTRDLGPVKFVKIDVQGYELAVSRGMRDLLEREPLLEISFEYSGSEALATFFLDRGFELAVMHHDGSLTPFDTAAVVLRRRGYCDLFASRNLVASVR